MQEIKKLISALIAPLAARPKGEIYQTITLTGDGENHGFPMPIDGWVMVSGNNNNQGTTAARCQLWGHPVQRLSSSISINANPGYSCQSIGFFKKGDLVNYNLYGYEENLARIIATIGGGLSSILQVIGGGLCLISHLFNRFTSSLVRKPCRANQTLTLEVCQRLVRGAKRTPLSQMDTLSCLGFTLRQLKSRTLQNTFELNHQQVFQQVFLFPLVKAIKSISTANTQEQGACSLSSLRQSAQANLACEGGAL